MKPIDENTDTTQFFGGIGKHIKRNDKEIELWYEGYEDYRENLNPFILDCSLRPDIEYYLKKQE